LEPLQLLPQTYLHSKITDSRLRNKYALALEVQVYYRTSNA
jgi:hypothetical protein